MKYDFNCQTVLKNNSKTIVDCSGNLTHDYLVFQMVVAVLLVFLSVYGLYRLKNDFSRWYYE